MIAAVLAAVLGGLVLGGLVAWLAASRRLREQSVLRERSESELRDSRSAESALHEQAAGLRSDLARSQADLDHARRSMDEKLELLRGAEQALRDAFRSLSAEALRANSSSFLELARASLSEFQSGARTDLDGRQRAIGDLVRPFEEKLRQVESALQGLEVKREGAYVALTQQIEFMRSTQERLETETSNLVRALRAPAARGKWGEIQLRRVIEMAGMLDHCDFQEQVSVDSESGRRQPDVVICLPGGKSIVVDAKAPLAAYLEALETTDEAAREARLKDHARQVRDHMARLGSKTYWQQFSPAPEFVVMFLPGEAFFAAALQQDPALIEYGVDRYVIPASPTTLIALLRAVHYGWQQERIAENAETIRVLGTELYDRLRILAAELKELGGALDKAVREYNRVCGSFEARALVGARKLRDLGAGSATSKEIPVLEQVERAVRTLEGTAAPQVSASERPEESDREAPAETPALPGA